MLKKMLKLIVVAHVGSALGSASRGLPTQRGVVLGPVRVLRSNVLPALGVGLACGGSSFYTLLTSYVLGSLFGDRFEP